jgi:valyl-tRNA synthetase
VASLENPGEGFEQDTDTFDTWFSSGQWPLLTLNFPDGADFKTFYPTQVMETGHDLIFKWVPRMVIFGLYRAKQVPFRTVYLHGLVNDAQGKKMSKSKGNVINPLELTEKFGTDALRMALVIGNTPGTSLALAPDKIKGYKNFANKIWNITRFVLSTEDIGELNTELAIELENLIKDVTTDMDNFRFYLAAEKIYAYAWHRFADEIIEESKGKVGYGVTLRHILTNTLKLLHPFMPFVTEEIWQLTHDDTSLLMIENWP